MVPSSLTVAFLVAVNLIPLFGVVFLGWGLFPIMFLYWLENGIIGLFNLPKIVLASAPLGGLPNSISGGPAAARPDLLLSKTAIDVRAHLKEHRKAERRLDEAPTKDWSSWTETKS